MGCCSPFGVDSATIHAATPFLRRTCGSQRFLAGRPLFLFNLWSKTPIAVVYYDSMNCVER